MRDNYIQKGEIVTMLAEIFNEIEDLEKTLAKNMLSIREEYLQEQLLRISDCDNQLSKLEERVEAQKQTNIEVRETNIKKPASMKLELGY